MTSKLDQNNSLLANLPDCQIIKLQRVQNCAAKLIFKAKKHDHVTSLFFELHWLPVHERIIFKVLLLTYKSLHGQGPQYLKDLLVWHRPARSLRSANSLQLDIPRTNFKTFGDRAFAAAAPKMWNSLPSYLRECSSVESFKQHLKTHLFKLAFNC